MRVTIYTTFALIDGVAPHAALRAIRTNIGNRAISEIIILTETSIDEMLKAEYMLRHDKIRFIQKEQRPTFQDMFNQINSIYETDGDGLAILLNSDISIPDEKVIYRLEKAITDITLKGEKVAFSLTRYEEKDAVEKITLKSSLGLPNIITSDAWVFNAPVDCRKDLYYSMGQMYCDKFINHDLIESGYKLYNPCLDCRVLHNEQDLKDAAYYRSLSDDKASRDIINRHWKSSVKEGNAYYGLSRLRSASMVAGYMPEPVRLTTSRHRLFVFLDEDVKWLEDYLDILVNTDNHPLLPMVDIYYVVQSVGLHAYIDMYLARFNISSNIYIYLVEDLDRIMQGLHAGMHDYYESIMLTWRWSCVNINMVKMAGTMFYDARNDVERLSVISRASAENYREIARESTQNPDMMPEDYAWVHMTDTGSGSSDEHGRTILVCNYNQMPNDVSRRHVDSNLAGVLFCSSKYADFVVNKFNIHENGINNE